MSHNICDWYWQSLFFSFFFFLFFLYINSLVEWSVCCWFVFVFFFNLKVFWQCMYVFKNQSYWIIFLKATIKKWSLLSETIRCFPGGIYSHCVIIHVITGGKQLPCNAALALINLLWGLIRKCMWRLWRLEWASLQWGNRQIVWHQLIAL